MSLDADTPVFAPDQRRHLWICLLVRMTGGFLLASCFVMPTVDGCTDPIVPAMEVSDYLFLEKKPASYLYPAAELPEWIYGLDSAPMELMSVVSWFFAAYFFGFVVALHAAFRLACLRGEMRISGRFATALIVIVSLIGMYSAVCFTMEAGGAAREVVPVLCLGTATLLILWRTGRGAFGNLSVVFVGAVLCLLWFGYWLDESLALNRMDVEDGPYYGLYLSFLAAGLLLVSVIAEAHMISGPTWTAVAVTLLIGRPPVARHLRCPNCRYDLRGQTELRCPECGRPFTWNEVAAVPEDIPQPEVVRSTADSG